MKQQLLALVLLLTSTLTLILSLEHEKSFLLKDGSTSVYSVALYRNSLLHTSTSDIVQKDVDTGAFQRTFRAHKGRVMDLIVTNSSTMFSAGIDDTIVMWDLETGAIIKRFRLGASGTLVQSISLQGDHIFAGGIDFKFRQVNVITGIVMRTFDVRSRIEKVVADGDFLYIGKSGIPPLAKVSILNGRNQLIFDEHSDGVFDIRLYNGMLFSASDDAFIVCWNVLNAAIIATYVGHTDGVRVITIWNDVLYSSSKDHTIIKWDISSTEILKISPYFTSSGARSFAFSDSYLISGGTDGILLKWDFNLGSPLFSYSGSDKRLRNVVSWKNYVISGGFTNEIKQWDTSQNSPDPFFIYAGNEESVNCLYIFEDALFSGGLDTLVLLWNLTSMIKSGVLRGHTEGVLAIVADQNFLHSVGDNRNIKQWIWKTGTFNGELLTGTDSIQYLQLSNEGLFSGSEQYVLYKWDVTSKTGIQVFVSLNQIFTIRIFEKYILIGSFGLAKISIENGESIAKSVICLSLVSSYTRIFSGHDDGLIRGRDVLSLGVLETYQGHVDAVFSLSIDEAGALYSASLDGSVRRWSYMTRRTAFSFEDRSGSVSSLTVLENHLFIGTRSGSLNTFDLSDTTIQGSMKMHNAAVTSLITDDSRVFTSGLDGVIFSMRQGFNENASIILNYSPLSLKGLFNLKNVLFFISDDTEIYSIGTNSSNPATKRVTSGIPLNCLSGYNGLILGGSKSGSIFAWSLDTAVLTYELRGHSSQVNSLGVSGDLLVSASDDQSIIIWSLVDMASVNVLKRVSSDSLGHIGPVNSISLCNGYVFSGGSDATTRRWNILSGKHEDVYFGASKSTTTVLCHNETVYTGGEDSAVLMFRPVFSKESNYKSTGTSSRDRRLVQTRLRQRISFSGMIDLQTIIPMIVGFAILAMVILGCTIYIFRYRNSKARRDISPGQKTSSEETSQAVTDLQTVVNSVIGISKHAAFLVEKWAIARDKKIAAGGGGELYLAKIMDPALKRKAREETVIQKVVFLKNKINEEAFFQEVGIMIMLSSFPCFCSIIAYTEDPFSMILKYYPEGALHEWLRSNKYSKKVAVAILSDTASALKIMHSYYLAHCDLKSKNILVELVNGQPSFRLTDFGITQILSEKVMDSRSFKIINLRGLSVDYASPEAFRNFRTSKYVRVDFKMYDIYSYGCLVKEVLTKTSPWG